MSVEREALAALLKACDDLANASLRAGYQARRRWEKARAAARIALATPAPVAAGEGVVSTTVRQTSLIIADYDEHFLVAHVSKDGSLVGIDHPCDAVWSDVMVAHVALRDRINERIAQQDGCPFKPTAWDEVQAALANRLRKEPTVAIDAPFTPVAAGEGMVMVPREPTEAMIEAGHEKYLAIKAETGWPLGSQHAAIYRAMLAAAPTQPPVIERLREMLGMFVNAAGPRRQDGHHELPLFSAEEMRRARAALGLTQDGAREEGR